MNNISFSYRKRKRGSPFSICRAFEYGSSLYGGSTVPLFMHFCLNMHYRHSRQLFLDPINSSGKQEES